MAQENWTLVYEPQARKMLRRLPEVIKIRIETALKKLAADPFDPQLDIKKLSGRPGCRLRVGDWRIIYELEGKRLLIQVLQIIHRQEAYKK